VNKPPVNAPDPVGWHHAHNIDPSEQNAGWQRGTPISAENSKALVRRFLKSLYVDGNLLVHDQATFSATDRCS